MTSTPFEEKRDVFAMPRKRSARDAHDEFACPVGDRCRVGAVEDDTPLLAA